MVNKTSMIPVLKKFPVRSQGTTIANYYRSSLSPNDILPQISTLQTEKGAHRAPTSGKFHNFLCPPLTIDKSPQEPRMTRATPDQKKKKKKGSNNEKKMQQLL